MTKEEIEQQMDEFARAVAKMTRDDPRRRELIEQLAELSKFLHPPTKN